MIEVSLCFGCTNLSKKNYCKILKQTTSQVITCKAFIELSEKRT